VVHVHFDAFLANIPGHVKKKSLPIGKKTINDMINFSLIAAAGLPGNN
jgi:hypothetical protein